MARGKRNRTERVQSLAQLLPKDGFDYECNPEIFTDHNYPGYVVKAVMVEWAAHKLIHPWMVDQLMERLFEKATKLAHNTESYGGLDNFWSVVCSQIDWIRTHHLMERIIVQELADGLMQARVRARTYGPYIRVEDGLSKTAVAIDNYHRRLADSNLHSLIPVLNEDDAKDFDDNGDYKSVPSEDEPPMEELLALDAQALEHLGLYDYVYGGQDYDMVPEFGSGNIMYETIEYIEIDGTGKRKPVVSQCNVHFPPDAETH